MNDELNMQFQSEFDLEDEWKPEPLIPQGTYRGHVTNVSFNGEQQCIIWSIVLQGNDGMCSDGTTPVDGMQAYYRNWLPRPGDEHTVSKSGKNKRQTKINMLKQFANDMQLQMNTKEDVIEALTDGLWIGIPVLAKVSISSYEGRTRNEVNKMTRDPEGEPVTPEDDDLPF